ncbi:MAG: hypothetical protein AABY64_13290 [Bdellovibrionota bacterium]|mgnify:CR=1 FL=1
MKKLILLAILNLPALTFASLQGASSGGGMPGRIPLPTEDFSYSCEAQLAEQTTVQEKTCYTSAKASFNLNKSDFKAYTGLYNATVNPKDFKWAPGLSAEACPTLPDSIHSDHMISFSSGGDKEGNKTINLHIRVLKDEGGEYLWASSDRNELFSFGEIRTSASLHQNQKSPNAPARNILLSMSVSCKRTK